MPKLLVLLAVLLASACQSTQESGLSPKAESFLSGGETFAAFQELHGEAVVDQTKRCMLERGFELIEAPVPVARPQIDEDVVGFGIVQSTYLGLSEHTQVDVPSPDSDPLMSNNAEDAAYNAALNGSDSRAGCRSIGRATADQRFQIHLLDDIESDLSEQGARFFASRAFIESVQDWSGCMNDGGYDFADRESMANYLNQLALETIGDQTRGLDAELRIFELDQSCPQPLALSSYDLDRQGRESLAELVRIANG